MKLKVFEAFAGYGSQAMALSRIRENYPQFDYEVVGISEIDKYALQAYQAVHGHCPNYGDISKIDWNTVPDFDLLTYSFPCTDISIAGQQKGLSKARGTRSSLLWECQRAIEIKRPKYLLMENVAALLSQKFLPDFKEWRNILGEYGYSSFTQILDATQFGVPQHRERTFMVSILGDCQYHFPAPFKLTKRLKDVLEPVVDEKYYLSDKVISGFDAHLGRMQERVTCIMEAIEEPKALSYTRDKDGSVTDRHLNDVYNTIHTSTGGGGNTDCYIAEPRIMQAGNLYPDTDNFKNRTMGRVYSADGISPTINCCGGGDREPKIIATRIRKLTPRECFRLMDVSEPNIDKLLNAGISNSQLYKLAGNSIVCSTIYHVLRKIFIEKENENQQLTLF